MCDIIRQCFGAAVSTFSRTFAVGVHGIECNGLDPQHDGSYPGVDARVVRVGTLVAFADHTDLCKPEQK